MRVRSGVSRFLVVFCVGAATLVLGASSAGASLDTVQGGITKLYVDTNTVQLLSEEGIVTVPIAPGIIIAEAGQAGVVLPITPGSLLESDTMLGTVDHTGGFRFQKPSTGQTFDATDPQIVNNEELWVKANGGPSAPANDLVNPVHSKNPCTGVITYTADAQANAGSALILNTTFSTDVFTAGMTLAHVLASIETRVIPQGADRRILGSSLLLTDGSSKKMTAQSKDPAVTAVSGGSTDPVVNGGSVRTCSQGFDVTYNLPAAGWTYTGKPANPTGYRFKSKTGPITLVDVKKNKGLKVLGKGAGLGHSLATNPNPIDFVVATGDKRYCARFGGTTAFIANKLFKSKKAPPPSTCPS